HAYGGTMLLTLPFLLDRLFGARARVIDRGLAAAGVTAALAGILLCAARQPVVMFAVATVIAWGCTRLNLTVGLVAIGLVIGGGLLAGTDERLQRAASLED